MIQPWRSTVALWSEMALAPSRVAQAQARMTLRMMQAASPWRLRLAAQSARLAPDGETRTTAVVLTLPGALAPAPAPEPVAVAEPVVVAAPAEVAALPAPTLVPEPAAEAEPAELAAPEPAELAAPEPVAAEPSQAVQATEATAPEAEHVPHGALAEASSLAVVAATAEEPLPGEPAEIPVMSEAPAPLAVLAEPTPETLETAALEPLLAMAEAAPAKAVPKGSAAAPSVRKPRTRRG